MQIDTPTPRTDAFFYRNCGPLTAESFARQLEQELNEAKAELQTQLNNIKEYDHHYTLHVQERDTLKRERDEAIKARNHNRICVERLASERDQLRKVVDELGNALALEMNPGFSCHALRNYSQLPHVKQKEAK